MIYSSAVSNRAFFPELVLQIWTEILTLRGYQLPSPKAKGEVLGTMFFVGVEDKAIFRATCLTILS